MGMPEGWTEVELGEVWHESRARAQPAAIAPTKYIGLEHVEGGTNRINGHGSSRGLKSTVAVFSPGDVLYGRLRPYLNKVIRPEEPGVASTEFLVFKESPALANALLVHLLSSSDLVGYASANSAGVNLPRVSGQRLGKYRFGLAPLPEQRRIVAMIEGLFAKLDEGVTALKRAEAKLERYRASVLKSAVEGRLTEQWREANPPEETGEELLERILAERRKRWDEEQLAKLAAKGRQPPKNWKKKYKEPVRPDTTGLPGLPEGWCWATLGQVFRVYVGSTPKRSNSAYWGGDIKWVSSGEVAFRDLWDTRERITSLGLESCSARVHPPGTVMLAMIGEGKTRGQTAVLRKAASHNQNSAAIRVSETGHEPQWVYCYLRARYEVTRASSSGNNQPALSKRRVERIPIPVPPTPEQRAIIGKVEPLLTSLDSALDDIVRATRHLGSLRQSILKRAFEGGLVPQDPDDEPASVLLGRIRAEQEAHRRPSMRRRQRRSRVP